MREHAVHHQVLITEHHLDRERERRRIADEGTESHGVDDAHDPCVLVAEDAVLPLQIVAHEKADVVEQPDGRRDDAGEHDPFGPSRQADSERRWQDEVKTDHGRDKADQQHRGDAREGAERAAGDVRGHLLGADIIHAEPGGDDQRNQDHHPDETGILNPGVRAGGDLSDQRAGSGF